MIDMVAAGEGEANRVAAVSVDQKIIIIVFRPQIPQKSGSK